MRRRLDVLETAEACLDEREKNALADGASAADLARLADERDELATQRDSLASEHDDRASRRDDVSLQRDVRSSARDVRARTIDKDRDVGFTDRFLAAVDRDDAAGDRADSFDDRAGSKRDRERAAEHRDRAAHDRAEALARTLRAENELATLRDALDSRNVIGQAQGLLMSRYGVDAEQAFAMLVRLSQESHLKVREVAARVVRMRNTGD
ncbi:MAG TPA: ANTAR domain-containing protein [Mycobacteriales bacterium]|nr:ANTAR domain-containing protein [Mycobacteriales bacterium]